MKPKSKIIPPQSPSMGPDVGENDLFPRCQHPDNRTIREAVTAIRMKLGMKPIKYNDKWYPRESTRPYRSNMKPVLCLDTGVVYASYREACEQLDLRIDSMSKHLKGYSSQTSVKGLRFRLI